MWILTVEDAEDACHWARTRNSNKDFTGMISKTTGRVRYLCEEMWKTKHDKANLWKQHGSYRCHPPMFLFNLISACWFFISLVSCNRHSYCLLFQQPLMAWQWVFGCKDLKFWCRWGKFGSKCSCPRSWLPFCVQVCKTFLDKLYMASDYICESTYWQLEDIAILWFCFK